MTYMNPMSHHTFAGLRHQELLAESESRRQRSNARRLERAARMKQRAAELTRKAAELVEQTHS
jgi:putative heme iron utilization protein